MVFALLLLRNTLCHCSCFFVSVLLKHICYHCFGRCFVAIEWYIVLFYWSLFLCFWKMHCIILSLFCSLFLSCWRIHCIIHSLFDSLFLCCWKVHCSGHYFSAVKEYIVSLFCSLFQGYWSIHCIIVLFTVSGLLKHTLCHCSVHCFSAIEGHTVSVLMPADSFSPGPLQVKEKETRHVVFTAETHNFPTGWFCHAGSVFCVSANLQTVVFTNGSWLNQQACQLHMDKKLSSSNNKIFMQRLKEV